MPVPILFYLEIAGYSVEIVTLASIVGGWVVGAVQFHPSTSDVGYSSRYYYKALQPRRSALYSISGVP
jgi:hypothetical protein